MHSLSIPSHARPDNFNGDLVTISDSTENVYLGNVCGGSAWIGYNDLAEESSWKWKVGSSSFVSWDAGEPNNSNEEDCAHFTKATLWNDNQCAAVLPFLCQQF